MNKITKFGPGSAAISGNVGRNVPSKNVRRAASAAAAAKDVFETTGRGATGKSYLDAFRAQDCASMHLAISDIVSRSEKCDEPILDGGLSNLPGAPTPLQAVAHMGMADLVQALLRAGAQVNHQNANAGNSTALMAAYAEHHWDVVDCLYDAGADAALTCESGRKASDLAQDDERSRQTRSKRKSLQEQVRALEIPPWAPLCMELDGAAETGLFKAFRR